MTSRQPPDFPVSSSNCAEGSSGIGAGDSTLLTVQNGMDTDPEECNTDLLCPICYELMIEAHITQCGHTFCFQCICKAIEAHKRCPKCNAILPSPQFCFPNCVVDELIAKDKLLHAATGAKHGGLKNFVVAEVKKLTLPDLNMMLETLHHRKQVLEAESCTAQNKLLFEFLKHLLKVKEEQEAQVSREIELVRKDIEEVRNALKETETSSTADTNVNPNEISSARDEQIIQNESIVQFCAKSEQQQPTTPNFVSRKRRMYAHFDDFVQTYLTMRQNDLSKSIAGNQSTKYSKNTSLEVFRENLSKFSKFSSLRPLATINYSNDLHNSSTIVSTIVFDKDNEYFAIGGVTKRIKVFDYLAVVQDTVDLHYPCIEILSSSKISCIAWNHYHKNILASSDYEGAINIWDVQTAMRSKCFHEHEKRCWSVDFNEVDTKLVASGSDDARVKLWSINVDHSIATLEAKANVCCVKFNPKSSCHLAFGSADHDVHYYDLRHMSKALYTFKGHRKAVSYVKFLNTEEIVSASTDSQLKLWNFNDPLYCNRTFTGHVNEKNFVGLATDGDYIACGSEDNALYIYYKGLSKPLFNYKIESEKNAEPDRLNDINDFVSAVCWRKECNVVLVANSKGVIKVLELD